MSIPKTVKEIEETSITDNSVTEDTTAITENTDTVLKGDTNCDGLVDIRDVSMLAQFIVKLKDPTEQGRLNADIITDDIIDVKDLGQLKKYMIKVITEL